VTGPRIGPRPFYFLMVMTVLPTTTDTVTAALLAHAGKDAVVSLLLGGAGAAGPLLLVAWALPRLPERLPTRGAFRLVLQVGVALLALTCLGLSVLVWGELILPVQVLLLPDTPRLVLCLPALFVVWYMAAGGLPALGQLASILAPLFFVSVALFVLLSLRFLRWSYALPLLPTHLGPVAGAAVFAYAFLVEGVLALYLGLFLKDRRAARAALFAALATDVAVLALAVLLPLLLFGPWYASRLLHPFTSATRAIHYGYMVERLDLVRRLVFVATIVLKLAILGFLTAHAGRTLVGRRVPQEVLAFAVLAFGAALALYLFRGVPDVLGAITGAWLRLGAPLLTALALAAALAGVWGGVRRAVGA
jgi:spore germination protein KB